MITKKRYLCNVKLFLQIGPFELPARLNGQTYGTFLTDDLPELLDDVPLLQRRNMWFQLDGAPPHYALNVRAILNRTFPNRWIGRRGPINWPARSPDLNPLDYFLWGHLKEAVYSREVIHTLENLQYKITESLVTVTPEMMQRAVLDLSRRARLCLQMEGGHFEHLPH